MQICKKCTMLDTRPRLTFNSEGVCSACEWSEEKKIEIDWAEREREFKILCDEIKGKHKYDCIVPVSGGKDSTYVSHKLKREYNLNILTITIKPPLETDLIQENLQSFLEFGYDNIKITPNPKILREINKKGFIEQGRPLLGWTTCLNSAMLQIATMMDIPLIMFGEEGESEYGGSKELRYQACYNVEDVINLYTYGQNPMSFLRDYPEKEVLWWIYPSKEQLQKSNIKLAHWSYFENWDPYNSYVLASEEYNMKVKDTRSIGTYTNYGQLDTPLYDLHAYMMYLKFGFGRCTQDACIDIRGGRLTREEAIELINKYDGEYVGEYVDMYCDYFLITREEFQNILNTHTNKDLFKVDEGKLIKLFDIK